LTFSVKTIQLKNKKFKSLADFHASNPKFKEFGLKKSSITSAKKSDWQSSTIVWTTLKQRQARETKQTTMMKTEVKQTTTMKTKWP